MDSIASEIERRFAGMSRSDKLLLLERLVRHLREEDARSDARVDEGLSAMAADPDIRREIARIAEEFASAEADGLEES